jgi:hypothetical protein
VICRDVLVAGKQHTGREFSHLPPLSSKAVSFFSGALHLKTLMPESRRDLHKATKLVMDGSIVFFDSTPSLQRLPFEKVY